MKVQSISLRNFRSFGPSLTTVELADLTALIGVNGSGKTALLWALSRIFGIAPGQKGLKKSDFLHTAVQRKDAARKHLPCHRTPSRLPGIERAADRSFDRCHPALFQTDAHR
jgi:predicted ATP-dependent endonuclease of OLD family